MASSVVNAVLNGYPSRVILNQIIQRYPQYANAISTAQAAGYSADVILKKLSNPDESAEDTDQYLTEHEKVQKRDTAQKRKAAMQAAGALGLGGAIAAGAYGYATRNQAVRPSQIMAAQRRQLPPGPAAQPTTINITPQGPRGGGGGVARPLPPQRQPARLTQQPLGIGYQPKGPQPPTAPNAPTPPGAPQAPQRDLSRNVDLVNNIRETTRFETVAKNNLDPIVAAQVLRKILPRSKVEILDKAEGGLEKVFSDYTEYLQANPPAVREQFQPPISQQADGLGIAQPEPEIAPEIEVSPEQATPQQAEQAIRQLEEPTPGLRERVKEAAFGREKPKRLSEVKPIRENSFAIPNYQYPGEPKEEFENRKILFDAVNKAAKALAEGKSFLDFPINKEAIKARGGYSTAADVLRFLAGTPNIYDPLLDDEEKDELVNSLTQSGQMGIPELAPTKGERNIYGAQMTPNLIWNLILSIEPRISTMKKPPSVKGYKMAPGKRMGTAELRRFLTHGVYGAVTGRTVSSELAAKIGRISNAAKDIDAIAKAAKEGNFRKMQDEMERLMDDEYFLQIMSQEVEGMLGEKNAD